jgi:hypothetical protein
MSAKCIMECINAALEVAYVIAYRLWKNLEEGATNGPKLHSGFRDG